MLSMSRNNVYSSSALLNSRTFFNNLIKIINFKGKMNKWKLVEIWSDVNFNGFQKNSFSFCVKFADII